MRFNRKKKLFPEGHPAKRFLSNASHLAFGRLLHSDICLFSLAAFFLLLGKKKKLEKEKKSFFCACLARGKFMNNDD
jgi:hypothetical protein